MTSVKESIFNDKMIPMDMCHIIGVTAWGKLNYKLIERDYSPTCISYNSLKTAFETVKAFANEKEISDYNMKVYFPKDKVGVVLVIWTRFGEPEAHDLVVTLAPMTPNPDKTCDDYPNVGDTS